MQKIATGCVAWYPFISKLKSSLMEFPHKLKMCLAYWKLLSNVQPVNVDDSTSGTVMWYQSCLCPVQDDV